VRRPGFVTLATIAVAVFASTAHADSRHRKDPPKDARKSSKEPWKDGVSAEAQKEALALFEEGNRLYEKVQYTEAVSKYEEALTKWDHPSIRLNLAVCLLRMRQPLLAFDNLTQALRYGDAPLGDQTFKEANAYMDTLQGLLAQVAITIVQPDVKVMLDGTQIMVGQGTKTIRVLPGMHQLVATKDGYDTDSRALNLPAGKVTNQELNLKKVKVTVEIHRENYERKYPWWVSWAGAGGGVAIGLIGTALYAHARTERSRYDNELLGMCPAGCTQDMIPSSLTNEEKSARRLSGVGIAMWVGGGAIVLGAVGLAIINRPFKVEEHKVTPALTVSKDQVGFGLSFVLD
jgi:hypothetical protein